MNSAEEFSKAMFGEDFKTKVPIEKVDSNSTFIGVLLVDSFHFFLSTFLTYSLLTLYNMLI